ncbi:hypothetical protein ZOD2009_10625 [Haladaptatus paucihalophilus DX253]|uniref:Uncharacterized protein n=1 Tax=Haladaptatus paucihalophilus DX253 TaxID=797209 RepID=E7QTJ7_HALPU|nr:hypothetical protein ZOD2009_10625 [Haladaptatus paucihalophilus DX253]SHK83281.1 hypothetical protein SAMN05444342_2327 [Haladaptatus paucihalophilus DX253]
MHESLKDVGLATRSLSLAVGILLGSRVSELFGFGSVLKFVLMFGSTLLSMVCIWWLRQIAYESG